MSEQVREVLKYKKLCGYNVKNIVLLQEVSKFTMPPIPNR